MSLIDFAMTEVVQCGFKTVGLLASPTTICTKLYQSRLEREGVQVITPIGKQLAVIEGCIRSVIAGKDVQQLKPSLLKIVRHMESASAEAIILGCTELSVIFSGDSDPLLIDPLSLATMQLLGGQNGR